MQRRAERSGRRKRARATPVGRERILRIALYAEPASLHPHHARSVLDRQILTNTHDRLLDLTARLAPAPMLATACERGADDRVYRLTLRHGVRFHDGTPLDAGVVCDHVRRMRHDGSARLAEMESVERVDAVDPRTVAITLREPHATFPTVLAGLAGMVVSPATADDEVPAGTGPFRVVDRAPERLVLERFEGYWDPAAVHLDRVECSIVPVEPGRVDALRAGEVDLLDEVPRDAVAGLRADPAVRISTRPGLGWQGIWYNTTRPPFAARALRLAVDAVLDRPRLVRRAFGDTALPIFQPFAAGTLAPGAAGRMPRASAAAARRYLAEAGCPDGFRFTLKAPAAEVDRDLAAAIREAAGAVGIDVAVEAVPFNALLQEMRTGAYDAAILGWAGRPDPDGNAAPAFGRGSPFNFTGFADAALEALLRHARAAADPAARRAWYAAVARRLREEVPVSFVFRPVDCKARRRAVRGFVHYPDSVIRLRGVRLAREARDGDPAVP